MILAGDVGGTKVHLALYNFSAGRLQPVRDQKFHAGEFGSLDAVVKKFLGDARTEEITAACFGCPGPVRNGRIQLTNLPWSLDVRDLTKSLDIEHIFLLNDLEANGYGIPELAPKDIFEIHSGDDAAVGNRGLLAAGTGLGEAFLLWDGKLNQHIPVPSEGGHCDFSPRSDRDIALFEYLRRTLKGRVSWERVVSGMGIQNIYAFLRDDQGKPEPAWLKERMQAEDPNAVIGQCAEDGSSDLCRETLEIFSEAYGAETGNIALKFLAVGGVYLGGGIAPKCLKTLTSGSFTKSYLDKGRLSPLLQSIPVRIILDDSCALLGAAAFAEARASEHSGRSERAASTVRSAVGSAQ